MHFGRKSTIAIIGLTLLAFTGPVRASSIIIDDNRLEAIHGFPDLGRGYNIQQNSLESVCFSKVEKPKPVFDFSYDIEEIDTAFLDRLATSGEHWTTKRYLTEIVKDHLDPDDKTIAHDGEKTQNVVARIVMTSYYNTLKESEGEISPNAALLLKNSQFVSFFGSCGFFYVRSIRFVSEFVALFQYDSTGEEEDAENFEAILKGNLLQFNPGKKFDEILTSESEKRHLRIYIRARGLGKGETKSGGTINLLPVSLREFRQTVQSAAQLMRLGETGVLDSMEVAPWRDHPQVLGLVAGEKKENLENFRRAQNLELNSQVITAIRRRLDQWMDEYYRSGLCETKLLERYPRITDGGFEPRGKQPDPARIYFKNHSVFAEREGIISLADFRRYFEENPPGKSLQGAIKFLQGSQPDQGADACLKALYDKGLSEAEFSAIPACLQTMNSLWIENRFIEDYCLPEPLSNSKTER